MKTYKELKESESDKRNDLAEIFGRSKVMNVQGKKLMKKYFKTSGQGMTQLERNACESIWKYVKS